MTIVQINPGQIGQNIEEKFYDLTPFYESKKLNENNSNDNPIIERQIGTDGEEMPIAPPNRVLVPSLDENSYIDLESIFARDYEGERLSKEQIIADDRLMDVIRSNLEARYMPGGLLTKVRRGAVGLGGGDVGGMQGRDYRNMDNDLVFEIWQNYQRSFAGGQSVTVGNEIAYTMNANDDIKVKLGAGYKLFDQMVNAYGGFFTGKSSFGEMADATWDYSKAGVWDPTTLLSLGLGKIFSFGATKTSALAAKKLMKEAYKKALKEGTTKALARKTIGTAVKNSLPAAFIDTTIAVGIDAASQMQLMDVGVQEDFSYLQSGFTAAGSMLVIPSLIAMGATAKELRKGPLKNTFLSYREFDDDFLTLGLSEAERLLKKRVKKSTITNYVDENFGLIKGDKKNFLGWKELKDKAEKRIKARGERYRDEEVMNAFFQYFWLGSPDNKGGKGFFKALQDSGFVVHPAMVKKYGSKTAVYANAMIEYLDDKQVRGIVERFEKDTNYKLKFSDVKYEKRIENGKVIDVEESFQVSGSQITAKSMGYHFARSVSQAGEALWLPSQLSRLQKAGVNMDDALEIAAGQTLKGEGPTLHNIRQFGLSVYKRLLTSHLSTTGANLKGFKALVSLNTMADFVTGGINMAQSKFYKYGLNNPKKAEEFYNKYYGSVYGALRRGFDVISPDIPVAYADMIMALDPKIQKKLFREVSGDGGVRESFEHFNLDKGNTIISSTGKVIDGFTKGAQTITFVRLQDDLTKRWAFGTNLNQYIMRGYGVTPDDFFARQDVSLEMASPKFQELVERATFRTMRETASVNWSTLPANNAFRAAAKQIEYFTNKTELGYIVPFGSFLNTTVATLGDLTAFNAFRAAYRTMTGKKADYADPEFTEAFGKAAVGISIIAFGVPEARERIAQGLSYSQDRNEDVIDIGGLKVGPNQDTGAIEDKTYDWPVSVLRLLSQIVAHGMKSTNSIRDFDFSEVPTDLIDEAVLQTGGQAIRDLDFAGRQIKYVVEQLKKGEVAPLKDLLGGIGERILSGTTRVFDTPNQVIGMFTDANMNPNLKEGLFLQGQAVRYINNIPKMFSKEGLSDELSLKATPFRGKELSNVDMGRNLLGVRTIKEPNVMERMANMAGLRYWDVFKTEGPNKIRNQMNQIAFPFFEMRAIEALKANKNFADLRQSDQVEIILDLSHKVKEDVRDYMERNVPKEINIIKLLSSKDKDRIRDIMDFLQLGDKELIDLLDDPEGLKHLRNIEHMLENYEKYEVIERFK